MRRMGYRESVRMRPVFVVACMALWMGQVDAQPAAEPRVLWRDERTDGARAIDLVFLPDGFREADRAEYEASVRRSIELLETGGPSFVRADRAGWNFHVAFVPSEEACPARKGQPARRTAFGTHLESEARGGMYASDEAAIDSAARAVTPHADCAIVVVRAEGAIRYATGDLPNEGRRIRLPLGMEDALLHELGHSIYGLGDEYASKALGLPDEERGVVAFYPNLTLDRSGARFGAMGIERGRLREGGLDFQSGVWRLDQVCVMRNYSADRFCAACAHVIRAGLPERPPATAPRIGAPAVRGRAGFVAGLEPGDSGVPLRSFAVLFRAGPETSDAALLERWRAAEARVSRKTRYMVSEWIGDGSIAGERVFSLEGHLREVGLGKLQPGDWALVAATANLAGHSPPAVLRFEVKADGMAAALDER